MAMFFDFPVSAPESYTPIDASWHPKHPLLALAAQEVRPDTEQSPYRMPFSSHLDCLRIHQKERVCVCVHVCVRACACVCVFC